MKVSKNVARWNRAIDVEEIFSEGVLGLFRAIQLFDPSRGTLLATYALYWIRAYTSKWVRRTMSVVRRTDRFGSPRQGGNYVVADASLEQRIGESRCLLDLIPDQASTQEESLLMRDELSNKRRTLKKSLGVLSRKERNVIRARYGGDTLRTLESISKCIGLSVEGVRKIEIRAIKKLKKAAQHQRETRTVAFG
jgi:RNA polymerase primary sigma factor